MPNDYETSIMATYFDMMKQFLESQERIMSMHLTGTANGRRPGPRMPRLMPTHPSVGNSEGGRDQVFPETTLPFKPEMPMFVSREATSQEEETNDAADIQKAEAAPPARQEKVSAEPERRPAERVDREALNKMLLHIVEEKTGYPPDMIGANQNLEADLGIDSIKRVEIVGALLKALPPIYNQTLGKDLGGLNSQPTLNGMLDIMEKVRTETGATVPFDSAGMGSAAYVPGHSFRHVMKPKQEPIDSSASKSLGRGSFIITRDAGGVAGEVIRTSPRPRLYGHAP